MREVKAGEDLEAGDVLVFNKGGEVVKFPTREKENHEIYDRLFGDQTGWDCNVFPYDFFSDPGDSRDLLRRIEETGRNKAFLSHLDDVLGLTGKDLGLGPLPIDREHRMAKYAMASPAEIAEAVLRILREEEKMEEKQEKQGNPFGPEFRVSNGYLCNGSLRLMKSDFDTAPDDETVEGFFKWMLERLNRTENDGPFKDGDLVQKKGKSSWRGRVVGRYSTWITPIGYAVESVFEPGSVQIYPATALEPWTEDRPQGIF